MPIAISEFTTPRGRRALRCDVAGLVSEGEAMALLERSRAFGGGKLVNLLSVVAPGTEYTSSARRIFTGDLDALTDRCAAVVQSRAVKAAINFMVRVSGHGDKMRMFQDEPAAVAWLDEPRGERP